jgi:hypothetical protein
MVNGRERLADCDCHVGVVAFDDAEVWPDGFGESPGQAYFVVKQHRHPPRIRMPFTGWVFVIAETIA